jgi:hypothetical protein
VQSGVLLAGKRPFSGGLPANVITVLSARRSNATDQVRSSASVKTVTIGYAANRFVFTQNPFHSKQVSLKTSFAAGYIFQSRAVKLKEQAEETGDQRRSKPTS